MDWPQNGAECRWGDVQIPSGEVIRDAHFALETSKPSVVDRSCMMTARRYSDAALLKALVRRWLE
jgi:hypothetical protein